MKVSVIYSNDALRELKKLDQKIAQRIVLKIKEYSTLNDPLSQAKPLKGRLVGKYRYRIGEYRAIFTIDETGTISILIILTIKHRKNIYRQQ